MTSERSLRVLIIEYDKDDPMISVWTTENNCFFSGEVMEYSIDVEYQNHVLNCDAKDHGPCNVGHMEEHNLFLYGFRRDGLVCSPDPNADFSAIVNYCGPTARIVKSKWQVRLGNRTVYSISPSRVYGDDECLLLAQVMKDEIEPNK